jgi:hypothetical protein
MRHILIAAAAVAGIGLAAPAAFAQEYDPGGPNRVGNMCKTITDSNREIGAYGFYAPCPEQQPAAALARATAKKRAR